MALGASLNISFLFHFLGKIMTDGPKTPIGFIQQSAMMIGPLSDETALEAKNFLMNNHWGLCFCWLFSIFCC
jgi:hypothetical protein